MNYYVLYGRQILADVTDIADQLGGDARCGTSVVGWGKRIGFNEWSHSTLVRSAEPLYLGAKVVVHSDGTAELDEEEDR